MPNIPGNIAHYLKKKKKSNFGTGCNTAHSECTKPGNTKEGGGGMLLLFR